jgi:hypothetical protein
MIALLLVLSGAGGASAQLSSIETELAPLEKRKRALEELLAQSPARFIEESLALADAYESLAKRHAAEPRSRGIGEDATATLSRAASAARFRANDPRQAIDLYRRAGAMHKSHFPPAGDFTYAEEIADIQQFDLKDRAAAAATLGALRTFFAQLPTGGELAEWNVWKMKWLEAEIAWLRSGKSFDGAVDAVALTGFIAQLYYGFGAGTVWPAPLDRAFNPSESRSLSPAELENILSAAPGSHNVFQRTWTLAVRLPAPAAVRVWLTRNDPGGFWTASMLTLAALADRDVDPAADPGFDIVALLVRTQDRKPTALALLAREYAKTHKLPARMDLRTGH